MEIEEVIMDKADLMEIRQISGGRYDLRKRTGAMWKRTEPSLSRLRSAPEVSGEPLRAVSLKRSRELVIYEGGQKADDAGKLGFMDRWHLEKPVGTRGGLLLLWDNSTEVRQILGNEFCIQVEIKGEGVSDWYWMTFVYMSTDRREREHQWTFLEDSKEQWGPCWLIAGDWNDIVDNEEKRGGVRRRNSSFVGFQEFIINMQMQEVDQLGSFFTCGNNREGDGYVEERLDKIFVSFELGAKFPNMVASNFYRSASDHNVLLFDTDKELERRHKRF
ncbi:mediator of RNA polymerase II transcription subunit [Striga asiatica]|uniref:Mediator of RNA polymerase II transcription subunit n=1 Tax=Striga asiatica TaxID=4170 RepID=A0A5A7QBF5_STRAF|nr:mediator of RNA polymerase II transcription subunit [Striga asiatica]